MLGEFQENVQGVGIFRVWVTGPGLFPTFTNGSELSLLHVFQRKIVFHPCYGGTVSICNTVYLLYKSMWFVCGKV